MHGSPCVEPSPAVSNRVVHAAERPIVRSIGEADLKSGACDIPVFLRDGGILQRAYEVAREAHDGQTRKGDGTPYIGHPVRVARLCRDNGGSDSMIAAALLHDVIEDAGVSADEIERRFGAEVRALVVALTEDETIPGYEQRKTTHRQQVEAAGVKAATIYMADKLANLRDMRELYASSGESSADRFKASLDLRFALWVGDADMVARVAPGLGLVVDLRAELDAYRRQRAESRAAS